MMNICGDFDNGTENCCKYCENFALWGVSTGYCVEKYEDMLSWDEACEKFKKSEENRKILRNSEVKMSNREKLFDALHKMSNEQLAESITLWCDECPARESCISRTVKDFSCTRFLKKWLNEKDC